MMATVEKNQSLGERLLAGRAQQQAQHGEYTGTIQMGGGFLRAFYRALDFREDRKIGQRHKMVRDEIEREIRLAADTLAMASVRTEAHIDGEVHDLPPLGLRLTRELGLDGPETDVQAVLALFPSERALVEQFVALEEWTSTVNQQVDESIEGESEAVAG